MIRERTEVFYGADAVMNTVLQFLYQTDGKIDACVDYTRPSLAIDIVILKKAFLDAKKRGVKLRYATEITKDNISYCKQMMTMVDELRHLDGIKGNFYVSETGYLAPATLHEAGKPAAQIIYSNVKEIIEHQKYVFETLWSKTIPAEQRIREIEEGTEAEFYEVITDNEKASQILVDMAKSTRREALIFLPNDKAMVRIDRLGIIDYLLKASQNGANVKIICPLSEENTEIQKKIYDSAPEIKILNGNNSPYGIYIIDREKFLRAELKWPGAEKFSDAIGLVIYSNRRTTVDSFESVFELLWNERMLVEELKRADRMQKEFISIAAHELRTPIQPILGLSEILLSKKGNIEQNKELLNVIIRNAKRLAKLTENILDGTKIESQPLKVNKQYFRLNDIIMNVLADHKKEEENNKQRKIKLAYSSNNDNIIVKADAERLTQVVSNLLSNAIKFTRKGEISVNITRDDTDQQIIVSVTDAGQGIDPEIMPRLFTKFATKSIVGTGLGLYISKRIIEAHGGKIWAENNSDGIGATFSFTLPLVIQQDHKESIVIDTVSTMINDIEERRKKRSIYYNSHKTKMKRIFLVDDDYDHTITFKVGLELAEFEVDAYNDSAIALSKFKPDYYDLLLIDVKMPKIDGFELYEKIRKIDDKVMVWFISAYETYYKALKEVSSTSKGEMSLGPVIGKPIEIDKLVKLIKTELD